MTLPIAVSVPHAGLRVPPEAEPYCQLTLDQIVKDGDEGAAETYRLQGEVAEFITTDVARAIVDLNRAANDFQADGVVKTETIWQEPIYRNPLPEEVILQLLENYYHPYHQQLAALTDRDLLFAVDCHTMAAVAPPIGPNPGSARPEVCLGNVNGKSFPAAWTTILVDCFRGAFSGFEVTLNQPFSGGFITRTHCQTLPWIQVELSRGDWLPIAERYPRILAALTAACEACRR